MKAQNATYGIYINVIFDVVLRLKVSEIQVVSWMRRFFAFSGVFSFFYLVQTFTTSRDSVSFLMFFLNFG